MKHLYVIIFFLFVASYISAQDNKISSAEEYFDDGEYFFNRGDYKEAVYHYLKLLESDTDNSNYNFKIGESYLNIQGMEAKAIPYFEKAVKNITEKNKYKKRSFEETKAPLHAYFYLGNAYRINNQLDKALEAYQTFVNSPLYYGNYNLTIVENEIKSCERAKIIEDNPIDVNEILLDENINTNAEELTPTLSGNEQVLVFIRRLKFYDAIFFSTLKDGKWTDPKNINFQIGSDGDFYPTCLSFDGTELYLVRQENKNSDIYISNFTDGKWSKAIKLDKKINSYANESHASISENGQLLFISSDRRGGKGGYDIYVSKKNKTNQWGKPKNLGKTINTSFDEVTPFSIKNGKVLFFSSEGHYNMGGKDIFYSIFENKKWKPPVNIGSPINNTSDNTFFNPTVEGNSGYISKFSSPGENKNIYKLEINLNFPNFEK